MINLPIFEVIQGYDSPVTNVIFAGKSNEMTKYNQSLFMHCGLPFPKQVTESFDTLPECLSVGFYCLSNSSYGLDNYDSLILNKYAKSFVRLDNDELKALGTLLKNNFIKNS